MREPPSCGPRGCTWGGFQLRESVGLCLGDLASRPRKRGLLPLSALLPACSVSLPATPLPGVCDDQEVTDQRPPQLGLCHTQGGWQRPPRPQTPAFLCQDVQHRELLQAQRGPSLSVLSSQILRTLVASTCLGSTRPEGRPGLTPGQPPTAPCPVCGGAERLQLLPARGQGTPGSRLITGRRRNRTRQCQVTDPESSPLGGKRAGLEAQVSPGEPWLSCSLQTSVRTAGPHGPGPQLGGPLSAS